MDTHKYRAPKRTRRAVTPPAPRQVSAANVARKLRRSGEADGKVDSNRPTRTRTIVAKDRVTRAIVSVKRIVQFLHPTKGWK